MTEGGVIIETWYSAGESGNEERFGAQARDSMDCSFGLTGTTLLYPFSTYQRSTLFPNFARFVDAPTTANFWVADGKNSLMRAALDMGGGGLSGGVNV